LIGKRQLIVRIKHSGYKRNDSVYPIGRGLMAKTIGSGEVQVKVITDSTSDIPQALADDLGIGVVPAYVRFGTKTYRDGVDIQSDDFYLMLHKSFIHPATSQPNPEDFAGMYKQYYGIAKGIVSIHISSKISGTYNSATLAKKMIGEEKQIEVIDSRFNSAGLGLVVIAAARMAQSGASFKEIINEANKAIKQVKMFGMFETMKYLARSGRVNKTIAAASRILHVMPLLTFHDGEIVSAGFVRTINKGIDRLYDFVKNNVPVSELTIVHSAVLERAKQLKNRLNEFTSIDKITIAELGPGLGVHGGPGVLLVAIRQSDTG
jgi:DegV family protein with EDD domain